jgi:ABC-2 type transport system permease protein
VRISKSWIVAAKDIKVFLRKRYTIYSLIVFPVIIGIGLPFVLHFVISRQGTLLRTQHLTDLMNAFAFFFAIGASLIPTLLASYSLVGEKVEKSLEPLLAAPVTDGELLLGKAIGAFIPSIGTLYIGSIFFMVLSDLFTHGTLGYYYFPNWTVGILLLILMPLMSVLSVEWSVLVSARATDPRAAQLQGVLVAIPLFFVYVATEVGAIKLNTANIWIISGVAFIADVVLFFLSTRVFRREEILTKWT